MSTFAEIPLNPCPHCRVEPVIKREPDTDVCWYVACSNELDCPVWPMTYLHATPAEAASAWNSGNVH